MPEDEKFYDYQIELKGKPKLDVTQPDSETTSIIKQFKSFELKPDNFKLFKVQLNTWYASKIASLNEQIYELAEQMKDFPEIDETNFQFADRKKLTKEQKLELALKLPIFTEEWRDKVSTLMRLMSKAFTNSIFLIDILWESNKKMSLFLEGTPIAIPIEKPIPKIITPRMRQNVAAQDLLAGRSASEISQLHGDFGLHSGNAIINAERGIVRGLKEGTISKDIVLKTIPEKADKLLKAAEIIV